MATFVGPNDFRGMVKDGLVFAIDGTNSRSYQDGDTTMKNLLDTQVGILQGIYSGETIDGVTGIKINNSPTRLSGIQLPTITAITTVSLWYYVNSTGSTRYLLDMRTGGASGYIYSGGPGTNWSSGSCYRNGVYVGTPTWINIESYINKWVNITVIANIPATDDMNLFQRYSDTEGYDVIFGLGCIYNRALTADEVLNNFNAQNNKYNIT